MFARCLADREDGRIVVGRVEIERGDAGEQMVLPGFLVTGRMRELELDQMRCTRPRSVALIRVPTFAVRGRIGWRGIRICGLDSVVLPRVLLESRAERGERDTTDLMLRGECVGAPGLFEVPTVAIRELGPEEA